MGAAIQFWVSGEPKGQPRPRAFARIGDDGNPHARVYNPATAEGWKAAIALAAKPHLPPKPLEGPVYVGATFYFRRPKSHFRTGKHSHELKPDAPAWHTGKPDRDNLDKALLDTLKAIGMIRDDAQACDGAPAKLYAPHWEGSARPGNADRRFECAGVWLNIRAMTGP